MRSPKSLNGTSVTAPGLERLGADAELDRGAALDDSGGEHLRDDGVCALALGAMLGAKRPDTR